MTYQEAISYLDSFINFEKSPEYNYKTSFKLERMKRFAALLGDPQNSLPSIHVAGSKGKGSTASYIQCILSAAGFKAGLYTSPHLVSFRERIRIGDELISEEDLALLVEKIKPIIDGHMKDNRPTFFEIYTAIAFLYFRQKRVDFAVYEVGLGGRLDATNLIEPLVSVITPISYEHTDKLGMTLREISMEKGGIIKSHSICISSPQENEALKTIEDICKDRKARLILVGKDIKFKELISDECANRFNVSGILKEYENLETSMIGPHQVVNAATAIGAVEALKFHNIIISEEAIRKGIKDSRWPGRLEVISKEPFIVLDGAHNKASAHILASAVEKIFKHKRLLLILGVSKDKDIKGILEELLPIAHEIILTKSKVSGRASDPFKLKDEISNMKRDARGIIVTQTTEEAFDKALFMALKDDLILITGSLFIVGEAREYCQKCMKIA